MLWLIKQCVLEVGINLCIASKKVSQVLRNNLRVVKLPPCCNVGCGYLAIDGVRVSCFPPME